MVQDPVRDRQLQDLFWGLAKERSLKEGLGFSEDFVGVYFLVRRLDQNASSMGYRHETARAAGGKARSYMQHELACRLGSIILCRTKVS
jgi:hypothetical protein